MTKIIEWFKWRKWRKKELKAFKEFVPYDEGYLPYKDLIDKIREED